MATTKPSGAKNGNGEKPADAIALLKADHRKVEELFAKFESASGKSAKQKIAHEICTELKVHAQIEEEIFYPAVREAIEDDDLMNEAQVEHQSAKELIAQLEGMKAGDPLYAATFTVLGEYILHHVKEEESEMFPQVRKAGLDLEALGRQMLARKEELMAMA